MSAQALIAKLEAIAADEPEIFEPIWQEMSKTDYKTRFDRFKGHLFFKSLDDGYRSKLIRGFCWLTQPLVDWNTWEYDEANEAVIALGRLLALSHDISPDGIALFKVDGKFEFIHKDDIETYDFRRS